HHSVNDYAIYAYLLNSQIVNDSDLDLLIRIPPHELVASGADRMLAELVAPALHRPWARDVEDEHREIGQEGRLRLLEGDAHGVRADRLHRADDRLVVEAGELRLPVLDGLAGLHLVVVLGMGRLP